MLVVDVEASASPVLFVFVAALGVHARFHTLVIQRIRLVLSISC